MEFPTMPRTAQRQERISLRVSPQSKLKLERAAAYADKTLTDFVVDVALQKAESVVREHEVITLAPDEWERFQELLLNPPEPNERLRKAFAEHARTVRS
jgi:uncharacterized protein (DUF1778 family)